LLRIHTFGGCFLEREGTRLDMLSGQRKGLALLALLATAGERGMSRETLLAYLWSESDEERARTSLKQLVHSLRTQLRTPDLLLPSAELRLNPNVIGSEVAEFREAVLRGDHDTTVALHTGAFLEGFYLKGADEFERWVATERASLARLNTRALEALAEQATERGETRRAVEWWRRLVNAEPLSARAATGLMLALDAAGERTAALQHARVYELIVRDEVGGAPDPSVLDVVSRLQRAGPVAVSASSDVHPSGNAPRPVAHLTDSARTRRSRWGLGVVAGALLVAAVGAYQTWPHGAATNAVAATTRASVAVLPFVNTSGDLGNEPFSDGLTDELIGTLGKISGLKVAGRTSSFALKGKGLGVRAIADTLGVGAVVEGSVRREGSRLKVAVQLVNTSDGTVIWTETYDRELVDAFTVQEEIARAIVAALRVKLVARSDRASSRRPTADPVAYELYLRGRYIWRERPGRDGILEAARYFEQAIARDSLYAQAYAGLSDAHTRLAVFGYGQPHEEFAKGKAAAQRALALDSTLADAHASLAHVLLVHDFDWAASEREFRLALALDPSYIFARTVLAICLSSQGRFDEAVADLDTARTTDPLDPAVGQVLGRIYVSQRQPDLAIRALGEALELNPQLDLSYEQLGHAYLQKRMYVEAITALRRAAVLSGIRDSAQLAYAYAVAGQRAEARRIVGMLLDSSKHRYVPPFHIAMAYAGLGEVDEAFRWLDQGYVERASFMNGIKAETAFQSLHADPRWSSLLGRMGLRR
jgi:TolB-like protein/DNA-binding SARP family transcriptional activator/tetratricopeptide (TPR) repeat protein